jgi:hypothetical protein
VGEGAKAVEHFKANKPEDLNAKERPGASSCSPRRKALPPGTVLAPDAELKAARAGADRGHQRRRGRRPDAVRRGVRASVALGVSYELSGDLAAARKVYAEAIARYPSYRATFEGHIERLDAQAPAAPPAGGVGRRPDPADAGRALLATLLLVQDEPKADDPEPGGVLLEGGGGRGRRQVQGGDRGRSTGRRRRTPSGPGRSPAAG